MSPNFLMAHVTANFRNDIHVKDSRQWCDAGCALRLKRLITITMTRTITPQLRSPWCRVHYGASSWMKRLWSSHPRTRSSLPLAKPFIFLPHKYLLTQSRLVLSIHQKDWEPIIGVYLEHKYTYIFGAINMAPCTYSNENKYGPCYSQADCKGRL